MVALRRAYVIGAGLAGLAAAERLSARGVAVTVFEATPKAGGRCRSFRDERLGRVIDNGNHLILSGNRAVLDYADRIGGGHLLDIGRAAYPFLDLATGRGWTVAPGRGPLGALSNGARPPDLGAGAMLADLARLVAAGPARSVTGAVGGSPAFPTFWDPMTRAVLNEPPDTASAALLRAALLRSFARGAGAAAPVFAPEGLGTALVDPALALLARRGVEMRMRHAAEALQGDDRLRTLRIAGGEIAMGEGEAAILALPARQAGGLVPHLPVPRAGLSILNAHFRTGDTELPPLLALVHADAQWLFRRGDVVSVTVSAFEASALAELPRDAALARLWGDVRRAAAAFGPPLPEAMPPARLLRERAATFDQTARGARGRSGPATPWPNLFLAGDHTATGLPATIEGAVRSGLAAADMALSRGV
ncbi:hydroxysqualene dehydroxylase HpnE [Palleronia sediminis]|uniref:hydroxysqualene dehydroxylase HpnE n=1 Tax=Palleronia sediminis TaxID=2547833 RepID=UPI001455B7D4|nr:hydroxysqualene dehydroxylase HpnE [Palleronia sediminis]